MKLRLFAAAAVLLVGSLWMTLWLQPERQMRRAQGRLMAALESRDFAAVEGMLAADFRAPGERDREFALRHLREVVGQFLFLSIERREEPEAAPITERIFFKGSGGPFANYAATELQKLREPFVFVWRRKGGPTEWELLRVEQPELAKKIQDGW